MTTDAPLPPSHSRHPVLSQYRSDIDDLRAIALCLVVLFHAFPQQVKGGFIGVYVFFVISVFLIFNHYLKILEEGRFSFIEFYGRRIKCIFSCSSPRNDYLRCLRLVRVVSI